MLLELPEDDETRIPLRPSRSSDFMSSSDMYLGVRPPPRFTEADEQSIRESFIDDVRRIRRLFDEDRLETARIETDIALSRYPEHPLLLGLAARVYTRLGHLERAETFWARLAESNPRSFDAWSSWGGILLRLKNFEMAEETLQRAYSLQPYHPPTVMLLLCLHAATDRDSEGAALLKTMAVPDLGLIANWLARDYEDFAGSIGESAYARVGRAILSGGEQIAVTPSLPFSPSPDLLTFSPAGEEVGALTEANGSKPDGAAPDMRRRLEQVNDLINEFGEAIQNEQWTAAFRIGSDTRAPRIGFTAPAFRAFVLYAKHRSGDDTAQDALHDLCAQHPSDLHARLRLIAIHMETARYANAETALRDMDARYPNHMMVELLLACALAETARHTEALAKLQGLDPQGRSFISRWFSSEQPYQQSILHEPMFEAWRQVYLVE